VELRTAGEHRIGEAGENCVGNLFRALGRLAVKQDREFIAANAGAAAETASAATTENTTFFIESAPFNSTGRRFWPIPYCLPARNRKSPRLRSRFGAF
jgi:hypothetical protein